MEAKIDPSPESQKAHRASDPVRSSSWPIVRFIGLFALIFMGLNWLLSGSGPVRPLNSAIDSLTILQARVATRVLGILGEDVTTVGDVIRGGSFSCGVGEACNGMIAVVLVLAGTLSFPVGWRQKALGLLWLLPGILVINLLRICGLYWTGAHFPRVFDAAHVYVGQILVIVLTAALWWGWLSWSFRPRAASS